MNTEHHGYVGRFREKLDRQRIEELVLLWLERFEAVEQVVGGSYQMATLRIASVADIIWEKDMQFRVLSGEQFTWIYITPGTRVVETSGLAPARDAMLCHDVLEGAPDCEEIINERNDRRLNELENQGLL